MYIHEGQPFLPGKGRLCHPLFVLPNLLQGITECPIEGLEGRIEVSLTLVSVLLKTGAYRLGPPVSSRPHLGHYL